MKNKTCHIYAWAFLLLLIFFEAPASAYPSFQFKDVIAKARHLAAKPFQAPPDEVPDLLKNITYDQWRDIRFKDTFTLWRQAKEPFKVRFFHPGFYYRWPVVINYVDARGVHRFAFSPEEFDYGKNDFQNKVPASLSFAGFRIHYPINTPAYADEIGVFLGASYFRSLGKHQVYGMSARGLAVDTGTDTGEEFPFFKEFWIVKPRAGDMKITVYALLDGQSVAGAYAYVIQPGEQTIMQVHSVLFFRKKIKKLGIAPLTSMFLYGENSGYQSYEDFRPEVHDSDGLLIWTRQGEWIWRPLIDPKTLFINTFEVGTPRGFGLLQRDTDFDHYQDLESRFDLRPSVWVTPAKDWGPGHVELIQIPSESEHNDNINAFWVPQDPPQPGQRLDLSYTLEWCPAWTKDVSRGYVTATRIQRQAGGQEQEATFVVDFQGRQIDAIPAEGDLTADVQATGAAIVQKQIVKNTVTGGWRLVFKIMIQPQGILKDVVPAQRPAIGLRAFLKSGGHPLTETWDYAFIP